MKPNAGSKVVSAGRTTGYNTLILNVGTRGIWYSLPLYQPTSATLPVPPPTATDGDDAARRGGLRRPETVCHGSGTVASSRPVQGAMLSGYPSGFVTLPCQTETSTLPAITPGSAGHRPGAFLRGAR